MGPSRPHRSSLSSTEVGFSLCLSSELILLFSMPRAAENPPPVQTGFGQLGRLTIKVDRDKGPPTSLCETSLKEEDLGLEDLERIVGREVAAVHTHPRHLHPNEPRVGLRGIPDAQNRAKNKDPSLL